jgi:parallel beta-helix repeat protein
MERPTQYARTRDGVKIAFTTKGSGTPFVEMPPIPFCHGAGPAEIPEWQAWDEELSRRGMLVMYDCRGTGMSDREVADYSLDGWVRDVDAVVDALRLDRFVLFAPDSLAVPVAIAYAARNADRVSHLILWQAHSHVHHGAVLENCVADGAGSAGNGIEVGGNSIVRACTSTNNNGTEIYAADRVVIEDCVANGWTGSVRGAGDGIRLTVGSTVRDCVVTNNAGNGIMAVGGGHGRLENNEVTENSGRGIYLNNGGGTVVIGNRSQANGEDCWDAGNNAFVKVTGVSVSTATHPWFNICG